MTLDALRAKLRELWKIDISNVPVHPDDSQCTGAADCLYCIAWESVRKAERLKAALAPFVEPLVAALAGYVEEPDAGVLRFYGGLQKDNGTAFTDQEREALLYSFLSWAESHGLGYGGALISPPTPDSRKAEALLAEIAAQVERRGVR